MKPTARRDAIVALVEDAGVVHVDDLAARFNASRETIRRDLAALDQAGKVRKFHGGARRASAPAALTEGPFDVRMATLSAEKDAIARCAAGLFEEGSVMFVDTGSTAIAFARALAKQRGMTVVTNSPEIARILSHAENGHRLYLLGGEVAAQGRETLGALVVQQVQSFKAAHVVLTIGGMTRTDIMDFDLRETEVARAMVERAGSVTVLADHSKLERAAVFDVAPLTSVDRLVTDRPPSPRMAEALRSAGVDVVVAGKD